MNFSCENKDDATRSFMARTSDECRKPIVDVTIPLYTEQDGRTLLCGTGVLLRIAEKYFIVSAGHTFDARRMLALPMWVTDGVVGNKLIPLGQVTIRSSETKVPYHRTDDPFDTAVCELTSETATKIGVEKRFLRLNDVDPWDKQDPRSWYMVFGYPTVLSPADEAAKSIHSHACALATFLYCDERGPVEGYDKEVGIALDFDPATILDDGGNPAIPPPPARHEWLWDLAAGRGRDRYPVVETRRHQARRHPALAQTGAERANGYSHPLRFADDLPQPR